MHNIYCIYFMTIYSRNGFPVAVVDFIKNVSPAPYGPVDIPCY